MKKFIYGFCLFLITQPVMAFDIDVDKIVLDAKSSTVISELDSTYEIDSPSLDNGVVNDEKAKEITKELLSITVSSKTLEEKKKEFVSYQYIDSTNGSSTLAGTIFINDYFDKLEENELSFDSFQTIRTVSFNDNEVLAFAYIDDALVDGEESDIVFAYWFKIVDDEYKLYFPWFKVDDDLEDYFNEVSLKEDSGVTIGGTSNNISLTSSSNEVSDELLQSIYDNNVGSSVQITGMDLNGSNVYGSGFFIREGVIVTTWSLFLQYLTGSNYIYVNDYEGNTYNVSGIISAQVSYDVVVLKLDKEVGKSVTFSSTDDLSVDDKLFTINSKVNGGFSINYGSFVNSKNGILNNLFALSSGDVGSALFNEEGKVVGFNVGDLINSDLSYAHSTDYLVKLQDILKNQEFADIEATSIDSFKDIYYFGYEDELTYNDVSDKVWNKYKEIGLIEEKITLSLIKASYVDNILSLRYKNESLNMIDSLYLVSSYVEELENEGYELSSSKENKLIYVNDEYKIIIREDLNYLVILIMEI